MVRIIAIYGRPRRMEVVIQFRGVDRKVFLSYLSEVNRLKERPKWYNALTGNCTTSIRKHTMPYNPKAQAADNNPAFSQLIRVGLPEKEMKQ